MPYSVFRLASGFSGTMTNKQERIGGVRYTIKDGIVYDAPRLLADVAAMVEREKQVVPTPVSPPVIPQEPPFATATPAS